MKKDDPFWYVLSGCASFLIGFILGGPASPYLIGYQVYQFAERFCLWLWGFAVGTITDPQVFWTAMASCAAIWALLFLRRQLVEMQKATEATKASVDVMTEVERGRVFIENVLMSEDNQRLHYSIRNGGPGAITLVSAGANAKVVPMDFDFNGETIKMPMGESWIQLSDQEVVKTKGHSCAGTIAMQPVRLNLTAEELANLDQTHLLMVCHYVCYSIGLNTYRTHRLTYTIAPTRSGIIVLTTPEMTGDERTTRIQGEKVDFKRVVKSMRGKKT